MVVDLDADSISEWDGGPLTQFVAPLPQVDAVLSVAAQGMEFAGAADPQALHALVTTTFRALLLALFGHYRLHITVAADAAGFAVAHFDEDAFAASLPPILTEVRSSLPSVPTRTVPPPPPEPPPSPERAAAAG